MIRASACCALVAALLVQPAPATRASQSSSFASLIARLSERGGDFDTDNLISNEKSYLQVIPTLKTMGVSGGAFVGVGPDQSFSYIAQIHPAIAFMLDVRRDNLLLHLLFKALFARARNRLEYLCLLTGRGFPSSSPTEGWEDAGLPTLVAYVDRARSDVVAVTALRRQLDEAVKGFGVPLSPEDLATIDRFHRTFINAGLSLQFESRGRPPRSYYPTYRELLLETDRAGRKWNFLATEDDFKFVQSLEARDLIVPVVGDVGGPHALRAVADLMTERQLRLSAFYISNVEMYVFRDGGFPKFVDNLNHLPRDRKSVIIRSVFGGPALPESTPGYYSTSLVRTVDSLVTGFTAGRYPTYWDLVDGR